MIYPLRFLRFFSIYLFELIKSNVVLAIDLLRITPPFESRVLSFECPLDNSVQIFFLTGLITMTPGTLSLDYCPETRLLTLHLLYGQNSEASIVQIRDDWAPEIRALFPTLPRRGLQR